MTGFLVEVGDAVEADMTENSVQKSLDTILFHLSAMSYSMKPGIAELRGYLESLGDALENFQESGLADPDVLDQLDLSDEVLAMELDEITDRKRQLQDDFDSLNDRLMKLFRISDCIDDLRSLWDDWEQLEQDESQLLASEEIDD